MIGHSGADKLAQYLSHDNCNLKRLNIAECKLTGRGALSLLSSLKRAALEVLRADRCNFGGYQISNIVNQALAVSLIQVFLDNCNLGSKGAIGVAEAVHRNKYLKVVSLRFNEIDDEAAKYFGYVLERYQTIYLEVLDLSNNNITDASGDQLARGIAKNDSLKKLIIKTNELGENSGKLLVEALQKNTSLQYLNCEENSIDFRYANKMEISLRRNRLISEKNEVPNLLKEKR